MIVESLANGHFFKKIVNNWIALGNCQFSNHLVFSEGVGGWLLEGQV